MDNKAENKWKVCPRCGFKDIFGNKINCPYCQFKLIGLEYNFFSVAFAPLKKDKETLTVEEIEKKYVKDSPFFSQELWDRRVKLEFEQQQSAEEQKRTQQEKLNARNMSICQICGCLYKGNPISCECCNSSQITALDITGIFWDGLSPKDRKKKRRELLVEHCYTCDKFDREKWRQRVVKRENRCINEPANIFVSNQKPHTEEYRDLMITEGKRCPACGSDQIQVTKQSGRFLVVTKLMCIKCKKIF
ncbi:MAG: hypothetical protein E7443_05675 [Ruminococcaceae bacterium]|nr:hypothetical protein [Oscillospiraceae bacterium]